MMVVEMNGLFGSNTLQLDSRLQLKIERMAWVNRWYGGDSKCARQPGI